MNVLLVQPDYPHYNLKFPPLGIGYLAAYVRGDHDVAISDLNVESRDAYLEKLDRADVVGINCLTRTFYWSKQIAAEAKKLGKTVVVGGPHVTFTAKETAANPNIDYVVKSEGEETFRELLRALDGGNPAAVRGIAYKNDGLVETAPRLLIGNLGVLPFPAYDLMDMKRYAENFMYGEPVTHIITSRGCPQQCVFCICAPLYDRHVRYRPASNVSDEIELLKGYGFGSFCFQDDTFGTNKKASKEICTEMIDRGLDVKWWTEMRLDRPDAELFSLMREAGCRGLAFGLESGNPEMLKRIKKGINLDEAGATMEMARRHGFETQVSIIIGLPGDTTETVRQTVDFARSLGANAYSVNILTPYPGTEVFEKRDELGIEVTADWDGYTRVDVPVMRTTNFSGEDLRRMRREIAEELNQSAVRDGRIHNSYLEAFVERKPRGTQV